MSTPTEPYSRQIADHYEDPYHRGPCEGLTHRGEGKLTLCDDEIEIGLCIDHDDASVTQAWFDGEGCEISQAAASILMEKIEGMGIDQLEEFTAAEMLKMFDPPIPVDRQKCGLLAWRVLQLSLQSPLDDTGNDGPTFGGPHLGEEN